MDADYTKYFDYIPSYYELTHLDKKRPYIYIICDICGSGYLRLTFNEELNNKISIDYMENGYLHNIGLGIRDKTDIIENKFYKLNKTNYEKIIKFIILVKQAIIEELNDIKWGK